MEQKKSSNRTNIMKTWQKFLMKISKTISSFIVFCSQMAPNTEQYGNIEITCIFLDLC